MIDLKLLISDRVCPDCMTKTLYFYPKNEDDLYVVTCDYCDFHEQYTEEELQAEGISSNDWEEPIKHTLVDKEEYLINHIALDLAFDAISRMIRTIPIHEIKADFLQTAKSRFEQMSSEQIDEMIRSFQSHEK